ncbi:MAG: hypothetical protein RLY70_4401 [Planctomycetota bacterium]|jgi:hypothetical protein
MKGAAGIAVAVMLGLLGAALNYVYLDNKTRHVKTESFIGLRQEARLRPGDPLKEEDLVEVRIPADNTGNLRKFVFLWQDLETVRGIRAIRAYQGGELLRREDYRTPPPELKLTKGQLLVWVTADNRSFVPDLVNPGDRVTFTVPSTRGPTPAVRPAGVPAGVPGADGSGADPAAGAGPRVDGGNVELIGPFVIAAIGSRLGSAEVSKALQGRSVNDFELGIFVRNEGTDAEPRMEAKAMRLIEMTRRVGNQGVGIVLHPREGS